MDGRLEELKASGLLLDLGVSVPVRPLGFGGRKKKRKGVKMRTPGMGGMMRISRKYLAIGVTAEEMAQFTFDQQMEFIAKHGKRVSELVACAIVRGYILGRLLNKPVAWWLRWRVHPGFLAEAMIQLLRLLDVQSFSIITKSAQMTNVMMRRLGH